MKRLSALFVSLFVAVMTFAQGNVTVTQSSAISDVVNGGKPAKQQTTTTVKKTTTTTQQKPATTTTQQKPATTTTQQKPVTTTTQQKPATTTTQQKPATTTTQQKPVTTTVDPIAKPTDPPGATATEESAAGAETTTAGEGTTTGGGGGGGGGVGIRPHTYAKQPARPQQQVIPSKVSAEDELMARTKEREVDYSSKSKKIMTGSHKIKGYRLQIYNGGNKAVDRQKAKEAAAKVKAQYPNMPVFVHFYSPRWMTLCGGYRSHKEAEEAQKKLIIGGFKKASIVRQEIILE